MTQIVVTLENWADSTLLRRMIENMKGVLRTSVENHAVSSDVEVNDAWFDKLHDVRKRVDSSLIDMDDERTRYIMSK